MVLGIFDQPGLFGIGPGASGCFWFLQAMSMRRVMRNPMSIGAGWACRMTVPLPAERE